MIHRFFTLISTLLLTFSLGSQTRLISDTDLVGGANYQWSPDTTYILDGLVVLEEGGSLSIEAGTVIKGKADPSDGEHTSALVIARGAQIFARGRRDAPILFTAEADDPLIPDDLTAEDKGLWGGLVLLGAARVGDEETLQIQLQGIAPPEDRYYYGGIEDEDNSGELSYVSIRHAGMELHEGEEDYLEGLMLAGVGSRTVLNYIETFASAHDGFEFLGGTAQAKYLVAAFAADDAFEVSQYWNGKGQFWLALNGEQEGDKGIELEGDLFGDVQNAAQPILSNLTLLGSGCTEAGNPLNTMGLQFSHGAAGLITNSIVRGYKYALQVDDEIGNNDSWQQLEEGRLQFRNNIWDAFCEGQEWDNSEDGILFVDEDAADPNAQLLIEVLGANSNGILDPGLSCICRSPDQCFNPSLVPGSLALANAQPLVDNFFEPVNYVGAFDLTDNWLNNWTALSTYNYLSSCRKVQGQLWEDLNQDCQLGAADEEAAFSNWLVNFIGEGTNHQGSTDANGRFTLLPAPGNYVARLIAPNDLWEICENDVPIVVGVGEDELPMLNFLVRPRASCPALTIDVSTPFIRRCFENRYYVDYCNQGTSEATEVAVEIGLDTFFQYIGSSIPPVQVTGDQLIFEIDTLAAGDCGTLYIDFVLDCEAPLGLTHCLEAHIFPDSLCLDEITGPQISIDGACTGDSLHFELRNIGTEDMLVPDKFVVIEDDVIFLEDNFQLPQSETRLVSFAANGRTYRMQAPEFPGNPKTKLVSKTIEGCGENSEGVISLGFVNQFPAPDQATFVAIDCQENIGSFDPNDKQGFPIGVSEDHFIEPNTTIEYLLRFQNTGTDTAFNITLVDTIDPGFDLNTIQVGAASHPFLWTVQDRTLLFNFSQILLPDSSTNEAASHGFVKFKIEPREELPLQTLLRNEVDIYFDFNEPIRTNQTLHTINEQFLDIIQETVPLGPNGILLQVFPNPSREGVTFKIKGGTLGEGAVIRIYDALGRLIRQAPFQTYYLLERRSLQQGIYYYNIQSKGHSLASGQLLLN